MKGDVLYVENFRAFYSHHFDWWIMAGVAAHQASDQKINKNGVFGEIWTPCSFYID